MYLRTRERRRLRAAAQAMLLAGVAVVVFLPRLDLAGLALSLPGLAG